MQLFTKKLNSIHRIIANQEVEINHSMFRILLSDIISMLHFTISSNMKKLEIDFFIMHILVKKDRQKRFRMRKDIIKYG